MVRAALLSFVLALTPLTAQQPADDAPSIASGRVVDATTGRPIPGVVVTPAGSAVVINAGTPVPPRALTNAAGEFVIRGLQKGMLHFTAAKSGYADAIYNQRRPGSSGQGIPLGAGQRLANLEIRMWRHASLSGTVLDEAGDPAVGVRVVAYEQSFVAGRKRFSAAGSGVTDDRGIYRIANMMPGSYAVGIPSTQNSVPDEVMDVFFGPAGGSAERRALVTRELSAIGSAVVPKGSQYAIGVGGQTYTLPPGTLMPQPAPQGGLLIYPTLFYPATSRLSQASVMTLRSGEERGSIDLQMHPARAYRVSGTVMGPDGPAEHVAVRLVDPNGSDAVESMEAATTVTSSSGEFTFVAVPPGQFMLAILRPPREPIDTNGQSRISVTPGGDVTVGTAVPLASATPPPPPPVPWDATLYAHVPLAVGESDLTGLVVTLSAAPRVSGRVEFDGTTEKPAANVLPRIRLNLDPADGSRLRDAGLAAEAGHPQEDGTFRTLGVPPGRYILRVNPPSGWSVKAALVAGIDITDQPFELTGKDLTGVVITFTDRPATLSGVVRTGMNPDGDALVIAFPTDTSAWQLRGPYPRRMRIARPARDGSYSIDGLLPGEYHVVAVHEESVRDWQDPKLLEALSRIARQVRVLDGERQAQDLATVVIR